MEFNKEITKLTVEKLKDTAEYLKSYGDKTAHVYATELAENLEFAMEILEKQEARAIYKLWKDALNNAVDFLQPAE